VLNSREWHGMHGIPSASFPPFPLPFSPFREGARTGEARAGQAREALRRRTATGGRTGGEGGRGRMRHNGCSSGRLKCSGDAARHRGAVAAATAARVKIKIARKNRTLSKVRADRGRSEG
jgi:hypothetical protein